MHTRVSLSDSMTSILITLVRKCKCPLELFTSSSSPLFILCSLVFSFLFLFDLFFLLCLSFLSLVCARTATPYTFDWSVASFFTHLICFESFWCLAAQALKRVRKKRKKKRKNDEQFLFFGLLILQSEQSVLKCTSFGTMPHYVEEEIILILPHMLLLDRIASLCVICRFDEFISSLK